MNAWLPIHRISYLKGRSSESQTLIDKVCSFGLAAQFKAAFALNKI